MTSYSVKDFLPGFADADTVTFDCDVVFADSVTIKELVLSTAVAKGISVAYTGSTASAKAISTAGFTLNNANLEDGYGAVEMDLTLTGTSAGHVAASSSWININTGTHGASGAYIAAQTNGVYEASGAVITGAKVVFGMRMDCICGDTDAAGYFPFSIVNNANTTTALFDANSATDIAYTVDAGTSGTKIGAVALFKIGSTVYYARVYDAAN